MTVNLKHLFPDHTLKQRRSALRPVKNTARKSSVVEQVNIYTNLSGSLPQASFPLPPKPHVKVRHGLCLCTRSISCLRACSIVPISIFLLRSLGLQVLLHDWVDHRAQLLAQMGHFTWMQLGMEETREIMLILELNGSYIEILHFKDTWWHLS